MDGSVDRADPPYLRIAGEIRARITAGRLRAGDRLPSARQITSEWGVAIATATKVLATLQQAGVAHSIPGVGTVVTDPTGASAGAASTITTASPAGPPDGAVDPRNVPAGTALGSGLPDAPRRREGEPELTRERIVRAAIAVADAEGMAALSMRRVAAELGVAAMSLYRHVPGKDELVLLMSDAVFGEEPLPEAPMHWRDAVELMARRQWAMYRAHPWIARIISFTRPMLAPNGMAYTEWSMRAMESVGLDAPAQLYVTLAVYSCVQGTAVNLELEAEAEQNTGVTSDEWMKAQEAAFFDIVASGRFPRLAGIAAVPDFDVELDELFELSLSLLLDGLAAYLARRA